MHSPRANCNSNITWIKNFDSDIPGTPAYINWAKHLYPLVGQFTEWDASDNNAFYSKIPGLKMFASRIQTPGLGDIDNAAIILAFDAASDSAYLQKLIIKASSRSQTNLLVIGNLSSPISLLLDVSCYRFLYIHMSDYYR